MRTNKMIRYIVCLLVFLICFSGIIRDDVSESKYLALANQKQFDCVGQIFNDSEAVGSTVLISPQAALTAAHVLLESDFLPDTFRMKGQTIISFRPVNVRIVDADKLYLVFKGRRVKAKKIIVHPEFLSDMDKGNCDLAYIELEEPVSDIQAASVYTGTDELNSKVTGVGFGASGKAGKSDSLVFGNKKIAGENTIDRISGPKYLSNKTILSCDFDSDSLKKCNKMGSPKPLPLEYICASGDSGGGLFKQVGNDWFLVGICSGINTDIKQLFRTGYYGQIMNWTRVSAFANWINSMNRL